MPKITPILFAILLLGCEDESKCNSVCENTKANLWHSVEYVEFYKNEHIGRTDFGSTGTFLRAKKNENGAIVRYMPWGRNEWQSVKISKGEWLDFLWSLHKHYAETEGKTGEAANKPCGKGKKGTWNASYNKGEEREHTINRNLFISYIEKKHCLNWDEIEKAIDGFVSAIRKKSEIPTESRLKAEYEKRFGEPISNTELSVSRINFYRKNKRDIEIVRTKTGATAYFGYYGKTWVSYSTYDYKSKTELSVGEWLDFVRALHKLGVYEWEGKNESNLFYGYKWVLDIYRSDNVDFSKMEGNDVYPPNWDAFVKIIDDIEAKIENDPSGNELESRLKAEYQKRFGEPISDLELLTNKVQLFQDTIILLTRTSTGALAEYYTHGTGRINLEAELEMDEWLDFIRALYKLRIDKWEDSHCTDNCDSKWTIYINGDWESGTEDRKYNRIIFGNLYPHNWNEFKKLMDGMVEKAREINEVNVKAELE